MDSEEFGGAFGDILSRERRHTDYMTTTYTVGLDLGQSQDFTAVSVLRLHLNKLEIVHLERYPLGTSYPDIVRKVKSLLATPKLAGKSTLVVDYTGCGRPVVDMLREKGLQCEAISITSGGKARQEYKNGKPTHNWFCPKLDLVSVLQVLMQNHKLEIAQGLKNGDTLARELKGFKSKISQSGHTRFEADTSWREEGNDDLILSVALASWWATRRPQPKIPMRMMSSIARM